jgi:hypothetical protein
MNKDLYTVSLCVFGRYAPFEATILSIALENIRTSLDSSWYLSETITCAILVNPSSAF